MGLWRRENRRQRGWGSRVGESRTFLRGLSSLREEPAAQRAHDQGDGGVCDGGVKAELYMQRLQSRGCPGTLSPLCRRVPQSPPVDYSPPGSSLHGVLQARILEWVAISSSRGPSQP